MERSMTVCHDAFIDVAKIVFYVNFGINVITMMFYSCLVQNFKLIRDNIINNLEPWGAGII